MPRSEKHRKISEAEIAKRKALIERLLSEGYLPLSAGNYSGGSGAIPEAARRLGLKKGSLVTSIRRGLMKIDWSKFRRASDERIPLPEPEFKRDLTKEIPKLIRKHSLTSGGLAERLKVDECDVTDAIGSLQEGGISLHLIGGRWQITPPPIGPKIGAERLRFLSDADGWHRWGFAVLGSKLTYSRGIG